MITPLYKALRDSENKELDDEDDIDLQYRYAMNEDVRDNDWIRCMFVFLNFEIRLAHWKVHGNFVRL